MSWSQILFLILSTIITTLLGWGFALLKAWLSKKIKDEELKKLVLGIDEIVESNVKYIYQTYVETLKDQDIFSKEKQEEALKKCKDLIYNDLNRDMKQYIIDHYGDLIKWITNKIETTIYDLKK